MSIAIKAEHVSKEYRLGIINHGMLFKDLKSWWAKKRGKEDPYSKIGTHHFDDQPDRFWALKDVSFEIEQGDRVGIVGRNGAGKSTLLKILSRVTEPTEGRVSIKGRVASLLEVGTGFHPELTGRDNIYLSGAIQGMKRREIDRRMDEIIAFSELEKFIDTPVKRYSSGMYVRLGFAVAAHLENEILLADEVLAVGDQEFQKKCLGKMEDVSKNEGRTVLFVSHNLESVRALCRNGVYLDKGRVALISNMTDVTDHYLNTVPKADVDEVSMGNIVTNTGNIMIRNFKLWKEVDKEDTIEGRLSFDCISTIRDLWFVVSIRNLKGELILELSSTRYGRFFSCTPGGYDLIVTFPNILNEGKYLLCLAAANNNQTIYYVENFCQFIVEPGLSNRMEDLVYKPSGALDISSEWKIQESEE